MSAIVRADKLSKWYGRVVGINDMTVDIGPGVTGLLGPNGSGKSTFMKMLIGALRPSRGTLKVFGQTVWGNPGLFSRIGYCPDHDGIYGDLTAFEFVEMMAKLSGMSDAEAHRRTGETLEEIGLADAMHRRIHGFSKGMRQRTKLAQTMVHDPDLLLLDEPLTGCDPLARIQLVKQIQRLGERGKTVIISSHILHEVESITSEVLLIFKGELLAEGNIYRIREMIDEHPHKISIDCDKPRELARELITSTAVSSIEVVDGSPQIIVETRKPDQCYDDIPERALASGLTINSLVSPDNNLQAVFEYLTEKRGPKGVARDTVRGGEGAQ